MCANTIIATAEPGTYASFVVNNLTADERYADLPYVKGEPNFRFYAGTPLVSQNGSNIGSLFIIEDTPREGFSDNDTRILGIMAELVMRQLDFEREFLQRVRYTKMTHGLTLLVTAQSEIEKEENAVDKIANFPPASQARSKQQKQDFPPTPTQSISRPSTPRSELYPSNLEPTEGQIRRQRPLFHRENSGTFLQRSAGLLCHSMGASSVLFLDTQSKKNLDRTRTTSDEPSTIVAEAIVPGMTQFQKAAPIPRSLLADLKSSYPEGRIWLFPDTSQPCSPVSSHGSECSIPLEPIDQFEEHVKTLLQDALPNARQILYVPMWDSLLQGGTSTCLVVSTEQWPALTYETDLPYVRVFTNSLSILYGQLAVKRAEEQREIFMSSISHELRTPLHGVVASSELLSGTSLEPRQAALCKTIEMCGQTLLDTIEQVLDHTKVKRNSRRRSASIKDGKTDNDDESGMLLQNIAPKNIAALCEEAIEVVIFSRAAAAELNKAPDGIGEDAIELVDAKSTKPEVPIVLEVEPDDWNFMCRPGELRRICLNLVTNSVKYTEGGHIEVKLSIRRASQDSSTAMVLISVLDTGRGMSAD